MSGTERGRSPADLTSLTIYIVEMDDYRTHAREVGGFWQRLVGTDYPALAGHRGLRLWDAAAVVEVQGFAVLP